MAITVSFSGDWMESVGNRRATKGTLTFDSSYATGGESLTAANVGLGRLDDIQFNQGTSGYIFEYDYSNAKVKVRRTGSGPAAAPLLVVEEAVTVSAHAGTLAYPPAYIVSVEVTAGGSTPTCHVVPTGETPAQSECAVSFVTGGLVFNTTDAVTAARVTYFPQREGHPIFDPSNLVVDEVIVASASKTALANRALAVQYVYDDTDGVRNVLEPVGEAPTATHNAVIDILNGSSGTDIDFHADDATNSIKVTYLKYPSSGFQSWQFINDTDITLNDAGATELWDWDADGGYSGAVGIVVPGYGTALVGEETATNKENVIGGPSETLADGVAVWEVLNNIIDTDNTGVLTTLATPFFIVSPLAANATGSLEEAESLTNLSAVSVRFRAVGV